MSDHQPGVVSAGYMAAALGMTRQGLQKLVTQGALEREGRGKFDLAKTIEAYVAFKMGQARREPGVGADGDRLKEARALEVEMRTAERDRRLINIGEAEAAFDRATGLFLETMSGLPAQIARDPRERQRLEALIDDRRERLSDRFGEIQSTLRSGEAADQAVAEDDAG